MSIEVVVLAAASALRPSTSTAAVYALLSSARPRRLLAAFTACGLVFSCAVGLIVVVALHGVSLPGGSSTRTAVVNLVAGAAMLGFASGVWSGHVDRLRERHVDRGPSRLTAALHEPTIRVAAGAGAATHLPGLFYLVALNAISADKPPLGRAAIEVLVYNLIWFSVPIAAFLVARKHAEGAHARIEQLNAWARAHQQGIVATVFAVVGAWLVVKGALELLD